MSGPVNVRPTDSVWSYEHQCFGTVLAVNQPRPTQPRRYTIRWDDGTITDQLRKDFQKRVRPRSASPAATPAGPTQTAATRATRGLRLGLLKQIFLNNHAEDPQTHTEFDAAVLNSLDKLIDRFGPKTGP